ncbi:MICAL-like protein 2 [Bagarius yarrelli]|uniref:MICAL-like protein 2 n=1 Tax=Bagarius yarrelli TaxID=175774 RepID=A0A556VXM4_BAGYA|nr:MICAL-like protein 2 [Bagarius yarrelli]
MDRSSGVKNQPVLAKAFSSVKPHTDIKDTTRYSQATPTTTNTINTNTTTTKTPSAHYSQATSTTNKSIINNTTTTTKTPSTHHSHATPTTTKTNNTINTNTTTKNIITTTTTKTPPAHYSQATPTTTKSIINTNTTTTKTPPAHYSQATPTTTISNTTTTKTLSAYYNQATPTTTKILNTTTTKTPSTHYSQATATTTKSIINNTTTVKTPSTYYSQVTPTITNTTTNNTINIQSQLSTKDSTHRILEKDSTQHIPGLFGVLYKTGSSTTPSPALTPASAAAPLYKPTPSPSVAVTVKSQTEQKVLSETPKGPSSSALKNLEARQRFFESSSNTVSNSASVSKGTTATTTYDKLGAGGAVAAGGVGKSKQLLQADDWIKDKRKEKEKDCDREKAKSVISKFVADETSRSSSLSSPHTVRSNTQSNMSPVPAANTRVLLKAPALDLELSTNPSASKTSGCLRLTEKSPARAANTHPSDSKEGVSSTSPSQKQSKADYIPREEILRELKEIEMKLNDLEKTGVELEKQLRQCEEGEQRNLSKSYTHSSTSCLTHTSPEQLACC